MDALTAPLKQSISAIASELLFLADYPIAAKWGCVDVGPYQLLVVVDACSGLNSMFSLRTHTGTTCIGTDAGIGARLHIALVLPFPADCVLRQYRQGK